MLQRASWLEIDSSALRGNILAIRRLLRSETQLMGIVKGNGYGHGAVIVAKQALALGVNRFAVATVGEGVELRQAGITVPILVLGHTPLSAVATALQHELTLTIHTDPNSAAQTSSVESDRLLMSTVSDVSDVHTDKVDHTIATFFEALAGIAAACGRPPTVHLKVNTGMNRLGFVPEQVGVLLQHLRTTQPLIHVEGIFTHFATADQPNDPFAQQQLKAFQTLLAELTAAGLRPPLAHAANSAATLQLSAAHFDLVRCGIALYGLHPDAEHCRLPAAFQSVMQWKAQVVQLTQLQPGDGVSYGHTFRAKVPTVVATIPVGYADGFPRTPNNWGTVLLHGVEVPIVGRVCMDQSVVDVTPLVERGIVVQPGDEVVLLGQQGQRSLTADEVGRRTGTINYEVVSRILPRVPRVVV